MFEWKSLLSPKRVPRTRSSQSSVATESDRDIRTEFEKDYDRVVFSEPFRRLAKKTQVHPLAPNDHIHNRLIHSIEVGSVGRSLGKKLQNFLQNIGETDERINDIPKITQVACLIHDIGNPPFGHAGEYTIREWVDSHKSLVFSDEHTITEATKTDILKFEGNAQGFRLASRPDNKSGYMRLTYASLGSMIKYPWDSCDVRAAEKYNVFSSEKEIFEDMATEMGLKLPDGRVARHPISFLTEAADDICYRILDMEDAVLMGILPEEPIKNLLYKIAGGQSDTASPIGEVRGKAIGALVNNAWNVFENDYENILKGDRQNDLKADFAAGNEDEFEKIKEYYLEIFSHRSKLSYEMGSYKILGRIIKSTIMSIQALVNLESNKEYKDLPFISQKCFELEWGKDYAIKHRNQSYEWWLRQAFDFVSGLTDNYAIQISKEIQGVLSN